MTTAQLLKNAKKCKSVAAMLTGGQRNRALYCMADEIVAATEEILAANDGDVFSVQDKISPVMIDRLKLDKKRVAAMADGIRQVAALPDPLARTLKDITRPNGIRIRKVAVPLGVVAIIFESRPNVTADAAALCVKSGNVSVLRAGKEAHASAKAIVCAMRRGLAKAGVPEGLINLIEDTSRKSAEEIMAATGLVDLLIPRGGAGLINACVQNAKVPCIQTGTGICHVYVDAEADTEMALGIVENAKCSRPSVCNAMEVCLVNARIAEDFLPKLWERISGENREHPVLLKLDKISSKILGDRQNCVLAGEYDFDTEFLDYVMAVKVVDGVKEAAEHIAAHSTGHSDCIVTEDKAAADFFVRAVDSAAVYVNASTRFTDGGEFGLGCEMGISTQKLHARGPMGLEELTAYKYIVSGSGQIR